MLADIKEDKISVLAPMARAMVGKSLGDTVVVQSPDGDREYEIGVFPVHFVEEGVDCLYCDVVAALATEEAAPEEAEIETIEDDTELLLETERVLMETLDPEL